MWCFIRDVLYLQYVTGNFLSKSSSWQMGHISSFSTAFCLTHPSSLSSSGSGHDAPEQLPSLWDVVLVTWSPCKSSRICLSARPYWKQSETQQMTWTCVNLLQDRSVETCGVWRTYIHDLSADEIYASKSYNEADWVRRGKNTVNGVWRISLPADVFTQIFLFLEGGTGARVRIT